MREHANTILAIVFGIMIPIAFVEVGYFSWPAEALHPCAKGNRRSVPAL
jgi:hypothetical protein